MRDLRQIKKSDAVFSNQIQQLLEVTREEGLSVLNKHFNENQTNKNAEVYLSTEMIFTFFIGLRDLVQRSDMLQSNIQGKRTFWKTGLHKLRQILASPSCFGAERKRFDVIMIRNKDDLFDALSESMFLYWLSKALCFFEFPSPISTENSNF